MRTVAPFLLPGRFFFSLFAPDAEEAEAMLLAVAGRSADVGREAPVVDLPPAVDGREAGLLVAVEGRELPSLLDLLVGDDSRDPLLPLLSEVDGRSPLLSAVDGLSRLSEVPGRC